MKIFRIFGPNSENRKWRMGNRDLYDLFNGPHIIDVIKTSRLRWLEHVGRREGTLLKKIYRGSIVEGWSRK